MNQILYTGGKKEKRSGPADIKSVVKFFCVSTIIFATAITGHASYAIYKNMSNNSGTSNVQEEKPSVSMEVVDNKVKLTVSHTKKIAKVTYKWNDEPEIEETSIQANNFEKIIEMPTGTNILYINITDIDGKEIAYEKEYKVGEGPQISLYAKEDGTITVTVTDDTGISYLSYKWDEEEPTIINATEENQTTLEQEISIPKGEHVLYVEAADEDNNKETKKQTVKGVAKPEISVFQDGQYLVISVLDYEQLTKVEITFNGGSMTKDLEEKEFKGKVQMKQGENIIQIKAYNKDGMSSEFGGRCEYNG